MNARRSTHGIGNRFALSLAAGVCLAALAAAQEKTAPLRLDDGQRSPAGKQGDDPQGGAPKPQDDTQLRSAEPSQKQLIQLFGKVETRLREMDKLLSDAGAGDTRALGKVGPSGIDELLKNTKKRGEEALQDIDKILEIARQMGQPSSSESSGTPQPGSGEGQGKDPLAGQQGTTTQRESTPTKPDSAEPKPDSKGGEKPKPDAKKPNGQGDPKDPRASPPQDPRNRPSNPPPGSPHDAPASGSDTRDRWGDLPVHVRDVFRSEGGRDMPVQYRDWIDAYYRRLNQKQP